jgi:hypothetical protein
MVISCGTTRRVGGWPGAPKNVLGTLVAVKSLLTSLVPIRLPDIDIAPKQ